MHFPGSPRISRVAGLALLCVFFLTTPMQAESGLKHRPEGTYLRKLAERGTIRIGIQKNIRPFHIAGNKDFPGFDVELGLSIARHMGLKPEFVYGDLDELVAMAAREEVDVALGGVSSDLRRGLKVNFTSPYIKTTPAALLNRKALPPETGSVDRLLPSPRRPARTAGRAPPTRKGRSRCCR